MKQVVVLGAGPKVYRFANKIVENCMLAMLQSGTF